VLHHLGSGPGRAYFNHGAGHGGRGGGKTSIEFSRAYGLVGQIIGGSTGNTKTSRSSVYSPTSAHVNTWEKFQHLIIQNVIVEIFLRALLQLLFAPGRNSHIS